MTRSFHVILNGFICSEYLSEFPLLTFHYQISCDLFWTALQKGFLGGFVPLSDNFLFDLWTKKLNHISNVAKN